ncbi:MAG: hypothetical protein M0Q48_09060 [Verrucomicrobia bacterium]|jgi:hypothetical protein|nr:hypothetical protein [Verrucomicrobiota bacterium]
MDTIVYSGFVFVSVAISVAWLCFLVLICLRILKMPTEKNLQALTDSITNESGKIRAALEELTKAVRESKEK